MTSAAVLAVERPGRPGGENGFLYRNPFYLTPTQARSSRVRR